MSSFPYISIVGDYDDLIELQDIIKGSMFLLYQSRSDRANIKIVPKNNTIKLLQPIRKNSTRTKNRPRTRKRSRSRTRITKRTKG